MIDIYRASDHGLRRHDRLDDPAASPVWVDLVHPSAEEEAAVERALGIAVPTREEMQEIEISSRLYQEDGALFMTATVLAKTDAEVPEARPITFVLTAHQLITIRYSEPRSFEAFAARAQRPGSGHVTPDQVLIGLLDAVVDRTADILERLALNVDKLSHDVFEHDIARPSSARDFHDVLRRLGRMGDLNSKARESLVSIGRVGAYLLLAFDTGKGRRDAKGRVKTLARDVQSLTDHASFLSNKINFLLDATLGMINIEQNAIIKIFSVAAVAFLPPTLIASIYGMNFQHMPELDWSFGYPLALGLMVMSAALPLWYFRRRGWL